MMRLAINIALFAFLICSTNITFAQTTVDKTIDAVEKTVETLSRDTTELKNELSKFTT